MEAPAPVRFGEPVEEELAPVTAQTVKDKLQFLSIELKARRKRDKEITEDEERCEGLGGLPRALGAVPLKGGD